MKTGAGHHAFNAAIIWINVASNCAAARPAMTHVSLSMRCVIVSVRAVNASISAVCLSACLLNSSIV